MSDAINDILKQVTTALSVDDISAESAKDAILSPLDAIGTLEEKDKAVVVLNLIHFARNIELLSPDMQQNVISQILAKINNPDVVLDERTGITLFLHSIKENDALLFNHLLTQSPNITVTDVMGYNSAYYAVMGDSLATLKALHQQGVDIKATTRNNETLLHAACANGNVDIVEYLLSEQLDPNVIEGLYGLTCLGTASAFSDNPAVIKKLQDYGARFTRSGKNNLTPFELALQENNTLSIAYYIDTNQADDALLDVENIPALLDAALFEKPKTRVSDEEERKVIQSKVRIKNFALYTIERNTTLDDCLSHANCSEHIQVICRQFNKTPLDLLDMELDDEQATMVRIALMT